MPGSELRVGVTMREVQAPSYDEPRDALARNWGGFLRMALPMAAWLPVPNLGADAVAEYSERWGLNALILTGGEDIGTSPMRDETELALLRRFLRAGLPVLGVCRGLQLIWHELGGQLESRSGHRAVRHSVRYVSQGDVPPGGSDLREVNSFHNYCLQAPTGAMREQPLAFAHAADGTIEGLHFRRGSVVGIMWHPEREPNPDANDVAMLRTLFGMRDQP